MENNRFAMTIVMVLVSIIIGFAEIVTKPSVTEVIVGGSTFLNCSTNSQQKIHWSHTPFGSNQKRNVYDNDQLYSPYAGRFKVDKNETIGAYNLFILVARTGDAGVYECQDESGQGKNESAQLIVLDTNLVCEPHVVTHKIIGPNKCGIEPSELIISCAVDYKGIEAPIMEWRRTSDNKSVSEGVTNGTIDNKRVVYNLTIKGNSTVKDGDSFFCSTTRSATSNVGCKSGSIVITGKVVDCSSADQLCIPYKAIMYILLAAIAGGTVFVVWYLRVKRTKTGRPRENRQQQHAEQLEHEYTELIDKQEKLTAAGKETIQKLTAENIRLLEKVNELEQQIYCSNNKAKTTAAKLAHTIVTKSAKTTNGPSPITGMAILDNNLFVVKKNCPVVDVYDSETFFLVRQLDTLNLTNPLDIASSKENKCLYIINRINGEPESNIWRFNFAGEGGKMWVTENDDGRLSTYEFNLIVCFSTKRIIIEYTPEGETVNVVRLSPGNGFNKLWHAVKLTGTHFVVSHSTVEGGQRVCVVDIKGSVFAAFEELPILSQGVSIFSRDHLPICLVGQCGESVLVADAYNNQVFLLSPKELEYEDVLIVTDRNLSPLKTDQQMPVRLCLNETKDRLFVGVNSGEYSKPEAWKEGCILIYNVSK